MSQGWVIIDGVLTLSGGMTLSSGQLKFPDGSATAPSLTFAANTNGGVYNGGGGSISFAVSGLYNGNIGQQGQGIWELPAAGWLSWGSSSSGPGTPDTVLVRDGAANTLALKNGTNAQTFNIYRTTTGPVKVALQSNASGGLQFNGVTSIGAFGVPYIVADGRLTGQTGAVASVATYTPTADGTFEISANVLVTASTTFSFSATCTYTDEGGTSRTVTLYFNPPSGFSVTATIANANGAVPYAGDPVTIRAKANTAITILTSGTFTSVTYNVEGIIKQIA